ncbi:unnamed protein product [Rotaria sp. Silwood1]|nr:unnamed protein product [Rotaria sp. Silwood1]CAF5024075.1 unnamed protein product [Rotaria sp. Silwood1]
MSISSFSNLSTGEIIGIVVGIILAVVAIIGILLTICALCCKSNKPSQVQPYSSYQYQQNPYGQPMRQGYYSQQQSWPPQQQRWNPQPMNYVQNPGYYNSQSNY